MIFFGQASLQHAIGHFMALCSAIIGVGQVVSRAGDDAGDLYATTRMLRIAETLMSLIAELLRWARLSVRSTQSIKAENLFCGASWGCISSAVSSLAGSTSRRELH